MSLGFTNTESIRRPKASPPEISLDVPSTERSVWGVGQRTIRMIIGLSYRLYFLLATSAIVWLGVEPSADSLTFAYMTAISISSLHFFFMWVGIAFISFYETYPVAPVSLYLYSDLFTAASLGACVATLSIDQKSDAVAYVANGVLVVSQMLCMRKTKQLLS